MLYSCIPKALHRQTWFLSKPGSRNLVVLYEYHKKKNMLFKIIKKLFFNFFHSPTIFSQAILAKMNDKVPHVSMQAITVLDACINNCGKDFHKMVATQVCIYFINLPKPV